jgi:cyanophycinase
MSTHLIGGGWDAAAAGAVYGSFLREAGTDPVIACVVLDEGDGTEQFARWAGALTGVAPCRPRPVLVQQGGRLDVAALGDAAGVLVCGGLTPAYAAALAPAAPDLLGWLHAGDRPYAGFSAGSAVAAARALVGGWLDGAVPVCPEDASEDLEQVTVVAGLGLVPFTVDVHAAQWGTLTRLVAAVRAGSTTGGVAIDENTALVVRDGAARVTGLGAAHLVRATGPRELGEVGVRSLRAGTDVSATALGHLGSADTQESAA